MHSTQSILTTDTLDQALLDSLRADSRTGIADLARQHGVARGTVQARLARMEDAGIITGYTLRTAAALDGIEAWVAISLSPRLADEQRTQGALRKLASVRALYSVSGPQDWLARVAAPTTGALDAAIDAIRALPGVSGTVTQIILSCKFER
jgi:DNA-binding Lrp family transcriptional regulator